MVKTFVIDPHEEQGKTPFLRGILTSSLQHAGLTFDEAYAVASEVREQLAERDEVTTEELREVVLRLISDYGSGAVQRYERPAAMPGTLLVRDSEGELTQFSREQHRRILESSGLSYEESTAVTSSIFTHLMDKSVKEIESSELGFLTYRYLRLKLGSETARRYLVLVKFLKRERPIVILVGGAPGTGKSALATEIAQRLQVVRIQSSDLLREVMRMMIPERLAPVLHRSSYDAWQALPGAGQSGKGQASLLIDGYRTQAELLTVPCEAVIKRSLREESSLIIEGVHVHHAMVEMVPDRSDVIVIPLMLAVLNKERLRDRFRGRGEKVDQRRAERYLTHFDSIWRLQYYLLSEADRQQIPIIASNYREQVIRDAMDAIVSTLSAKLTAQPHEVFSKSRSGFD
ncbi:MAG: zeta toxin family protein [Kiloniellales bacterium]|nr:zeta toxin family protein [Kiloniellales bacterium]